MCTRPIACHLHVILCWSAVLSLLLPFSTPSITITIIIPQEPMCLVREFADRVNNTQWVACCFSGSGDYVAAGSAQRQEHRVSVWDAAGGDRTHELGGPGEGVLDVKVC